MLNSPALILSSSNPRIPAAEKVDSWLRAAGITVFVESWRGDLDLDDPRVSPLAGDLRGLGPLCVISEIARPRRPDARLPEHRGSRPEW
jgi:hypothetical protein